MAISVPSVEVANEVRTESIWSPFAVCDSVVGSDCEAESLISARELVQTAFILVYCLDPLLSFTESTLESWGKRFEVGIELNDACVMSVDGLIDMGRCK